ncbi:unnamed protein product [Coffea canephora]|uniref:Uncharacterized protein n=1 Tax=Coffea canephora TaxID=49390 RepID=A0A068TXV8_COFCA|nr:unnamed protein product [Coffea canephora]
MEGWKPTIVTNAEGQRTMPSVVAYTKNGDRLVGQIAKTGIDSSAISDEFKHKSAKHEQTKMPFNSGQICAQSHRKSSKYAFLIV